MGLTNDFTLWTDNSRGLWSTRWDFAGFLPRKCKHFHTHSGMTHSFHVHNPAVQKKRTNKSVFRRIFATLQKLLPVRLRGPWVENFTLWLPDFLSGPSFCWSNTRQQHSNDKECFPHRPNDWKMPDEFWVNPSTVDSHDQLPSEPVPIDHTLI